MIRAFAGQEQGQMTFNLAAMKNGRCHLHGGKSTGSKIPEGRLIQKMASWKHGMRSKEAIAEAKMVRQIIQKFRTEINLQSCSNNP